LSSQDKEFAKELLLKRRQDRDRRIMAHKLHMENAEKMHDEKASKRGFSENENPNEGIDEGNVANRIANLLKDKTSSMRSRIKKSRARARSLAKGL
jgi:hypothetical protein